MGRNATVTQAESFWAIEELLAEGQVPSWQRVRERVGDRGSPVLLGAHIKAWHAENGHYFRDKIDRVKVFKQEAAATASLPESVHAQLKSATAAAMKQLDLAHNERVAVLDAREQGLLAQQEALLDRERALDDRQSAQAGFVSDLKLELAAAKEAKGRAETGMIELQSQLAVAGEQITQAREQLLQAAQQTKTAEQATIEQIRDNATLTAQVSSTEQQVRKLESEAAAALANVQGLQAALAKAQDQAAQAVAAHQHRDAELSIQIGRLTEQLAEAQAISRIKDQALKQQTEEATRLQAALAARDAALELAQQHHQQAATEHRGLVELINGVKKAIGDQADRQSGALDASGTVLADVQAMVRRLVEKPSVVPEADH